jgi:preprotein translocase subunit SecE
MTNIVARVSRYIREVRAEVRKVTWPSRDDVMRMTSVVLVVLLVASIFLAIVDYGFSRLMQFVISLGGA